jgi:serine/threonine-protein kinase
LEGSLRRTKEHLYLHVALIDTWDGHELWAEGYDRSLGEAANLRGDLATGIADALDAILSLEESKRAQNPTPSKPDAHALYLRGRKFEQTLAFAISDYEAAEMLYTQAIALDPRFALAHARLASTLGLLYSFRGPDEELKSRAYAEVREALRLQPHLGEARLVSALCSYRLNDDFDRTRAELEHARQFLTDDIEAMSCLASLDRRRGAWRDAKSGMEHCLAREPENLAYQEELYVTAYMLRDWQAAEANAVRLCSLAPEQPLAKAQKTMVEVWKQGDVQPLHRLFTDIHSYGDAEGVLTWMRWDAAMMLRDPAAARAAIDDFPFETLSSVYGAPVPKAYLEGCLALLIGQSALAKAKFELCRPAYEAETLAHPENALRHARLGLLYAYLGRKENAIREGQRAVALIPTERDHVEGPKMLSHLALIYARVGESDKAIEMIQSLLPTPAGVFFGEASMSHAELRLRWQWDLLRPQSRFETILAAAEPHTTY